MIERASREPTYEWNQRRTLTYSHGPRLIPTSSTSVTVVEAAPSSKQSDQNSSRQSGVSSWRITVLRASNGDMVAAGRPNLPSPSCSITLTMREVALAEYKAFKTEVVSQLESLGPDDCWRLTGREIDAVLREIVDDPVAPSVN